MVYFIFSIFEIQRKLDLKFETITYEPPHGKTSNLQAKKKAQISNCEADQPFCYRYISCDCKARFVSDLVGTQIVGFLTHRLIHVKPKF